MIVVDASVVAAALSVEGKDGDSARGRLIEAGDLHAPHLVDLEVTSVLRRRCHLGGIEEQQVDAALEDLRELRLTRYPHFPLLPRIWELRSNLSPYDAAYVALAEALECSFVTGDQKLGRAPGIQCEVEVL